MKAYLITMLIIFVLGVVSGDEKPSEAVKAWAMIIRFGMIGWTIYLLVSL